MANPLPTLVGPWLETLVAGDWLCFRSHGLAAFCFLRSIRLRPEILWAAQQFWDPDVHVFRFGDDELCPTVEEFQAYLQGFASSVIVVPPYMKNMRKLLKTCLDLSGGGADTLLSGGQINVRSLVEWYRPEGGTEDTAAQARRQFALTICVLAAYLLVSPDGRVNPSLVSVAAQMGAQKNVVPLVLAETLMGLDLVSTGQVVIFGGSPLLLQLWLSDKLGLIMAPEVTWPHLPGRMHQRGLIYPEMSEEEWFQFMKEMSPKEIHWRHTALNIANMATKSAGFERMVIAGLSRSTFYIPGRILRQLGISQGLNRAGIETFHILAFTAQHLAGYEHSWGLRQLEGVDPTFNTKLMHRYKAWLRKEVARRQQAG